MKLSIVLVLLLFNVMLMGIEIQAGLNYDIMGTHTRFIDEYAKHYVDVDNGLSPYFQVLYKINSSKLGLGIEYQPLRSLRHVSKDTSPYITQVSYLPVYIVAQLPVNTTSTIFEGIAEVGYAFNLCQTEQTYYFDEGCDKPGILILSEGKLRGGMHAGIGFAIRVNQVAFQMMYKFEHGYFDPDSTSRSYLETSHLSIGVRWDIDLKGL